MTLRPSQRQADQLRDISFTLGYAKHAEGSCLVKCGDTHVLCTASVDAGVPGWLKGKSKGWVTAEYGMLPRATGDRMDREAAKGKQSGRTQEIQRLIGRALRSVVDLTKLGERQIRIDCDVIQADGGTRTAAITGGYLALYQALSWMKAQNAFTELPLTDSVAAISCGIYNGTSVLDLDYAEDSTAHTDGNFVITGTGGLVEVQATAEGAVMSETQFLELLAHAKHGCAQLKAMQDEAIKHAGLA
jgi:ribonuclease PH